MESFLQRLQNGEVLVSDGAMGTMLLQHGLPPGRCPELMNLERPEVVEDIARSYADAGADIVHTNTFGGSPLKLADYGLEEKCGELNRTAVAATRQGVGERVYISASFGPSGRILQPYGDTDLDTLRRSTERQMQALLDGGVDLVCVETMTDLQEATLAVETAKALSPQIPVIATMTFDPTPRGFFTVMGVSIGQAAEALEAAGADVIGSNCGNGMEKMVRIAGEFRKETALPVIIQSNAGQPEIRAGQVIYPETPEFFEGKVMELLAAGVAVIGGCCGTTPDYTRAIRRAVDQWSERQV